MLALIAACLFQPAGTIERDSFGVPVIRAANEVAAFELFGQAVAEDRLWQMEMARRIARGRLAEVRGQSGLASDRAQLRTAYTDEELATQFAALPERYRTLVQAYVQGVNRTISNRKSNKTLPPGYAELGFEPEPWTEIDSCAISVMLMRQFGRGGAGELRNLALQQYLASSPSKDRVLDVLDDLAWQNDPRSIPTVAPDDDLNARRPPIFPVPTRAETEGHLKALPKTSLLELAPAIQLALHEDVDLVAEANSVVHKMGSYAIVVSPSRSATGNALLLSAPQMGHQSPSVIHEVAIDSPTLRVAGINVPGVPSIAIGHTPNMAWGLTSGVADIEDVFVSPILEDGQISHAGKPVALQKMTSTIKVKGAADVTVTQERTPHGPVLLNSRVGKAVYSLRSSFWGRELASIAASSELWFATTPTDLVRIHPRLAVTFNLFYAFRNGETGYLYCGHMPVRAKGYDPRFPVLDRPEYQWQGLVSASQMPQVKNPKSGLLANWNNKPSAWWPNLDTPVWGRVFRNEVLLNAIPKGKLTTFDLERAAWEIARRDSTTNSAFAPMIKAAIAGDPELAKSEAGRLMLAYDGWHTDGSAAPVLYDATVSELRRELFLTKLGNFTGDNLFVTVLQPSVMLQALEGKTKVNYLDGKSASEVIKTAFAKAITRLQGQLGPNPFAWRYTPGSIRVPDQAPIPYISRGTYIQVVEMAGRPIGRNVVSPGVAESGPHAYDQVPLARAWTYKPMIRWP